MTIHQTPLDGCFIMEPKVFTDLRGTFTEVFHQKDFTEKTGLEINFVQDNQSTSSYGVLRGLHLQMGEEGQAKLVRVVKGEVLDVVVDVRPDSKTFGEHFKIHLSAENNKQLFIPRGFAHGFISLAEESIFAYKCDNYYNPKAEAGIQFNDATLQIDWHLPSDKLIVSEKDLALPSFKNFSTWLKK